MSDDRDMPTVRELVGGPLVDSVGFGVRLAVQVILGVGSVWVAVQLLGFRPAVIVILAFLVMNQVFDQLLDKEGLP